MPELQSEITVTKTKERAIIKIYNTRTCIKLKKPEKKECDPIFEMAYERIGTREI